MRKVSLKILCGKVRMSRQNYYKSRKVRQRREVDEQLVKELVNVQRARQPRLGGLKLHKLLEKDLQAVGIKLGRDRFMLALKNKGLLLKPLKKGPRTTNSRHSLPVFRNLVKEMELTGPHQVWVSDITYIRIKEDFAYLSLITDKYSRKVVGYHLGRTLQTEDVLKALEMALKQKPREAKTIHHSDRGCQYCSHEYVNRLKEEELEISMTEENHCAENATAERMNGILKQEYYLKDGFRDIEQASEAIREAIELYNTERPHRSLRFETPEKVHGLMA